ncbi:hypothetical protein EW145_g6269 [Phellinidium pouzarii]|uniref:Phosphoglycerate mutase-like protein n=1 Tax=Phellinidium pouzarii TaxID=167371 RepID=A0A4S4KX85_9AGAM|nr:hypothetical protein EW145_g6269 [Phellinidium pouzarii]
MTSHPVVRVYLVRHGETNENRMRIIQGQMDTDLNLGGVDQARLCGEALKDVRFCLAFTSDLKRAFKTAELIMQYHPNVKLVQHVGLRERYMGELQGVRVGGYDRSKLPKSVETSEAFTRRTLAWWEEAIGQHLPNISIPPGSEPLHVLAVSHGAFIASLCQVLVMAKVIEAPPDMFFGRCFNTSITTIDMRVDKCGTLLKYCDVSHLAQPALETNADAELKPN